MTKTSKPIIFFGTEDFSLGALQSLVESGFSVVAVITKPDSPKGRGQHVTPPSVKVFAEKHSIPVLQPQKLSDCIDTISAFNNPAGVLVSYGKIIPQTVLDLFEPGIINVHPSLLPTYRGPSPIETAILSGNEQTGVSIMKLVAAMDAGPVYSQVRLTLSGHETATDLYAALGKMGSELLVSTLPSILDGSLQPHAQDDKAASYCSMIMKSDGTIDWNDSAVQIERKIRAYRDWPQSRTTLGKTDVIITAAAAVQNSHNLSPGQLKVQYSDDTEGLFVGTSDGAVQINALKPLGKKEMPVSAFLDGYRSRFGY